VLSSSGKIGAVPSPPLWTVLIPVKQTAIAKSRLTGIASSVRQELALAFACDVVEAGLRCSRVGEVVVVTNDGPAGTRLATLGARILPDVPDAGLNAALTFAAGSVRSRSPAAHLAVMSADLPAARPVDIEAALAAAPAARWFVTDLAGDGTTMLGAPPPLDLAPAFGAGSAEAHRASGAADIGAPALLRLSLDVDTAADLRAAVDLGVGAATAAALSDAGWPANLSR
jgi:2-phospho-L-lactate/phosphoenolpyruvate guanylyltransferase